MGIGRFAFTPVLPFMVRAGELKLADTGWVAAANYAGYLVGALTAARVPLDARGLAVLGLVGTAVVTPAPWPGARYRPRSCCAFSRAWLRSTRTLTILTTRTR